MNNYRHYSQLTCCDKGTQDNHCFTEVIHPSTRFIEFFFKDAITGLSQVSCSDSSEKSLDKTH